MAELLTCSLPQALEVWADLEDALRGEHGFGGHVAEIYAYRLVGHSPSFAVLPLNSEAGQEAAREFALQASTAMTALLHAFIDRRRCLVRVDVGRFDRGKAFGAGDRLEPQAHRWHIEVRPDPDERRRG